MAEINKNQEISEGLEAAQMHFETGTYFEEEDFENIKDYREYCEYLEYGPVGFCDEFEDVLDLDPDFIREYGRRNQYEIDKTESEESDECLYCKHFELDENQPWAISGVCKLNGIAVNSHHCCKHYIEYEEE